MEQNQTNNISEENVKTSVNTGFKPFVKASERAENYKSSAYSLLLVGGVGIVFLFLALTGIISIKIAENIRVVGFVAMLVMFLIFIFVGIKSLVEAKTIDAMASEEDNLSDSIMDYFKNNHNSESIDKVAFSEEDWNLREEMKFFKREEVIRKLIIDNFGNVDPSFLDNEIEKMYNMIFED